MINVYKQANASFKSASLTVASDVSVLSLKFSLKQNYFIKQFKPLKLVNLLRSKLIFKLEFLSIINELNV